MYYKSKKVSNKVIIWIIIIIISVLVLGTAGYILSQIPGKKKKEQESQVAIVPKLSLSLSTEEPNQESVDIIAKASTDDVEGISKIELDGFDSVSGNEAKFKVTRNGTYEVSTYGVNGQYISQKIEVQNIKVIDATRPYVPIGFTHVEGTTVDTGFVIEDEQKNQFVWVPVPKGFMNRDKNTDPDYRDDSNSVTELTNSVALYKGFYIGRYEAGQGISSKGDYIPTSKAGVYPWVNVDFNTANSAAERMARAYNYKGVKTSIINSYAWCTVIEWIDQTLGPIFDGQVFSSSVERGNSTGNVIYTGSTETDLVNNIYDLAGNVREWTTETYTVAGNRNSPMSGGVDNIPEVYRVLRGASAQTPEQTPTKVTVYSPKYTENTWGFRVIMYKQ